MLRLPVTDSTHETREPAWIKVGAPGIEPGAPGFRKRWQMACFQGFMGVWAYDRYTIKPRIGARDCP